MSETERAADLRRRRHLAVDAGRPAAVDRQHNLGKLTARERIAYLVGKSRFWEFGMLADAERGTAEREEPVAAGDGVVTGIGDINGRPAVLASFDFTVFGGSNGKVGGLKFARCCERARCDGLPLVMLLDGGGHRIQEGLDSHHFAHGALMFQDLVDLSGDVPIVAAMLGPGFAGPSNFAAMADFVVMVRGMATMGMAGPALVRAATGEDLSKEELGGADTQARLGVTDLAVDTEHEALDAVRVFLSYLPANSAEKPPCQERFNPPKHADRNLRVPANPRRVYDVHTVIDGLADADSVFEIKAKHAPNIVTSLIRLGGRPVGVIANQPLYLGGALDSPACEKAAHFIAVCDAFGLALLFLIDVPGFLVGSKSNTTQLARRSGRMLFELGQATVPRFSVVLRKGYGAGYIAMCGGRSFSADLALAWPTAEICAMSVDGAVNVAFRREIESSEDPVARRAQLVDGFKAQIDPFLAARGFGVDDVVVPAETRTVLLDALARTPIRRRIKDSRKTRPISPI